MLEAEENGEMKYKTPEELQEAIWNFNRFDSISQDEIMTIKALRDLNLNLKWKVYKALYDFIDKFLF